MSRPLALDLFCGAGGATRGLQMAGFEVVGIDIKKQPRYVGEHFIQADALNPPFDLSRFDLIWASPPCQAHVRGLKNSPHYGVHADRIAEVRALIARARVSFVLENVPGAPLRPDAKLGGWMFPPLKVIRERWFECSFPIMAPGHLADRGLLHRGYLSIAGTGIQKWCVDRGYRFGAAAARDAMGIDWMTRAELSQAIPPVYSEFIGKWALRHLGGERAA